MVNNNGNSKEKQLLKQALAKAKVLLQMAAQNSDDSRILDDALNAVDQALEASQSLPDRKVPLREVALRMGDVRKMQSLRKGGPARYPFLRRERHGTRYETFSTEKLLKKYFDELENQNEEKKKK
jgi:hypothetical protein